MSAWQVVLSLLVDYVVEYLEFLLLLCGTIYSMALVRRQILHTDKLWLYLPGWLCSLAWLGQAANPDLRLTPAELAKFDWALIGTIWTLMMVSSLHQPAGARPACGPLAAFVFFSALVGHSVATGLFPADKQYDSCGLALGMALALAGYLVCQQHAPFSQQANVAERHLPAISFVQSQSHNFLDSWAS